MKSILIAAAIALLIRLFVLQDFSVNGISMNPNFQNGEVVLTNELFFKFEGLSTGEVVIFQPPIKYNVLFIKRVIATAGETVSMKNGTVFINGKILNQWWEYNNHKSWLDHYNLSPEKILPGHVFVLGDNRANSYDSRFFGQVPISSISGEVWFVIWPLKDMSLVKS